MAINFNTGDLHVCVDSGTVIFGDADGDGDPGVSSADLEMFGGQDLADLRETEYFLLLLDMNGDGIRDIAVGVPPQAPTETLAADPLTCSNVDINDCFGLFYVDIPHTTGVFAAFSVLQSGDTLRTDAAFNGFPANFLSTAGVNVVVRNNPSSSAPHLQFSIERYDLLVDAAGAVDAETGLPIQVSTTSPYSLSFFGVAGSFQDDGIGEDQVAPLSLGVFELSYACGGGDGAVDACGECGGIGSSCADCLGVAFGTSTFDACGECNGDGSSCCSLPDEAAVSSCPNGAFAIASSTETFCMLLTEFNQAAPAQGCTAEITTDGSTSVAAFQGDYDVCTVQTVTIDDQEVLVDVELSSSTRSVSLAGACTTNGDEPVLTFTESMRRRRQTPTEITLQTPGVVRQCPVANEVDVTFPDACDGKLGVITDRARDGVFETHCFEFGEDFEPRSCSLFIASSLPGVGTAFNGNYTSCVRSFAADGSLSSFTLGGFDGPTEHTVRYVAGCNNGALTYSPDPSRKRQVGGSPVVALAGFVVLAGGASGDPHLIGADGEKFTFYGRPNEVYALFSSPQFVVNMRLLDHGPKARFIDSLFIRFRSVNLRFDTGTYRADRMQDRLDKQLANVGGRVHVSDRVIELELCVGHVITIEQRVDTVKGRQLYHLDVEVSVPGCHETYGGVLGETYRCASAQHVEWSRDREESFRVRKQWSPSGTFQTRAPCHTARDFAASGSLMRGGSQN